MSLKINREILSVNEKIYEGSQEQSVELDYILPDYYPDIFKMVKCTISPFITAYGINGDILNYEISADIRILYCSENNNKIQCITQRLTYNKSLNIGSSVNNPVISITPKSDYVNCRVVNKRRIDMRGAVSVKIKICGDSKQEAVCDIFGLNTQSKKVSVEYMAKKIIQNKIIVLNEDVEMNMSNPAVESILRTDIRLSDTDKKIIANKLVVKGEANVKMLYTSSDSIETMSFAVPYSQIIDMEGIDESFNCSVKVTPLMCDIAANSANEGENKLIKCELKLNISCCAYKTVPVQLVTDAYSTAYPCEYASLKLAVEQPPVIINENFQCKINLENDENNISCVYDVWTNVKNLNISINTAEKSINISGMICCQAMIKNESNYPVIIEKDSAFEYSVKCDDITENSSADIEVIPDDCTYTLTDSNGIAVKADLKIRGELFSSSFIEAITDINVDDTVKITRDGDYALKLYYGIKDENIWNIAKKYSTSINAIMEENSLENEYLSEDGMLLIPIV